MWKPWTPVAVETPELHRDELTGWLQSEEVLVFRKGGGKCVATYEAHTLWDEDEPEYRWYTADSERWEITREVTHWTPLPDDPK